MIASSHYMLSQHLSSGSTLYWASDSDVFRGHMLPWSHPRKISQTLEKSGDKMKASERPHRRKPRNQKKIEENKAKTEREKKAGVEHLRGQLSVRTELRRPERAPHDTARRLGKGGASGSTVSSGTRLQ